MSENPVLPEKIALRRATVALIFLLIAAAVAWVRWHLLAVPLDRDEGEYAYMGQLWLQGVPPYREAYNMKLPGVYGAYAALEWVFGATTRGLRLGFLLMNLATLTGLFLLARRLFDARSALWAAAAFAILSQSATFLALAGQATHFINLCVLPGFYLLLEARMLEARRSRRAALFLGAGLCFGAAFLMKQQAVFLVLAALGWALVSPHGARRFDWKNAAIFTSGAALPYGIVCLHFWRSGDFASFWFWTVEYARAYTQIVSLPDAATNFAARIRDFRPDWVLLGAGLLGGALSSAKSASFRGLWLAWLGGACLSAVPGFYFRPHYFIPLLPVLCLGIAGGWHELQTLSPRATASGWNFQHLLATSIGAMGLGLSLLTHLPSWARPAEQYARETYPGNPTAEAEQIAHYLARVAAPDERIAVVGSEPQIYFGARRRAATGFLYAYPLMESQPFALDMQHQMAREIERHDPAWLVFENVNWAWGQTPQSHRFIFDWFWRYQSNYRCVAMIEMRPDGSHWEWNARPDKRLKTPYLSLWRRRNTPVEYAH